jgi:hypothetical protein
MCFRRAIQGREKTLEQRQLSGLARAFFYAGGRSLLVSNWRIDNESAHRNEFRKIVLIANPHPRQSIAAVDMPSRALTERPTAVAKGDLRDGAEEILARRLEPGDLRDYVELMVGTFSALTADRKLATTARPSTGSNPKKFGLHSVGIGALRESTRNCCGTTVFVDSQPRCTQ